VSKTSQSTPGNLKKALQFEGRSNGAAEDDRLQKLDSIQEMSEDVTTIRGSLVLQNVLHVSTTLSHFSTQNNIEFIDVVLWTK